MKYMLPSVVIITTNPQLSYRYPSRNINLSLQISHDAFWSHIFDLCELIAIEEVRNYIKIVYIENIFENS